jgi:hypothetical protein
MGIVFVWRIAATDAFEPHGTRSLALHQITHRLKRVWIAADPHYIEHDVSILDHAGFPQPLPEGVDERLVVPAGR